MSRSVEKNNSSGTGKSTIWGSCKKISTISLLLCFSLGGCSSPESETNYPICNSEEKQLPFCLPKLVVPEIDSANPLLRVYRCALVENKKYEITLVFADETHPDALIDELYRDYRKRNYKRTQDIETFYIEKNAQGKREYFLPETFAGDACRFSETGLHNTKRFPAKDTLILGTRNHCFHVLDNNPELKKRVIALDTVLGGEGSRRLIDPDLSEQ